MDLTTVISQVRAGDNEAITQLVARHQQLAFGYAYAILGDFHTAQDATQQAFIAAYSSLHTLEDPEKFPNWLKSIVRHECMRIIRKRKVATLRLDTTADTPGSDVTPEQFAESEEISATVIQAIKALPPLEREVTVLYYIKDLTQREVATFLGLPVTTVNNRLYAARQRLRAALVSPAAVDATLERHRLPDTFSAEVGRIIRSFGPIVDILHGFNDAPPIFDQLVVDPFSSDSQGQLVVAQHLIGNVARCVALPAARRPINPITGARAFKAAWRPSQYIALETLQGVVGALGGTRNRTEGRILETGIKAIDLACPFPEGGRVAVFGDLGVGKFVLVQELVHRLTARNLPLTMFVFVRSDDEVPFLRSLRTSEHDLFLSSPTVEVVYLPSPEPQALLADATSDWFDATVFLTRTLARRGIHPAIDVLASSSRMLNSATVGDEHYAIAQDVRRLLFLHRRYVDAGTDRSDDDKVQMTRSERIEQFLSQPLYVAEEWTRQPGCFVSHADTVTSFRAIISGTCDATPLADLGYRGAIDGGTLPSRLHA